MSHSSCVPRRRRPAPGEARAPTQEGAVTRAPTEERTKQATLPLPPRWNCRMLAGPRSRGSCGSSSSLPPAHAGTLASARVRVRACAAGWHAGVSVCSLTSPLELTSPPSRRALELTSPSRRALELLADIAARRPRGVPSRRALELPLELTSPPSRRALEACPRADVATSARGHACAHACAHALEQIFRVHACAQAWRACNAPLQEQSWENAVSGAVANSTMWHFPGFALERACNAPLQERSWAKCRLGCSRKHYEIAFSQFCPEAPGCTGVPGCPGARVPGRGPGGARRCPEVLPGTPGAFLKLRASEDRSSSSLSWGPRGADGRGADLVFGRAGHAALMDDLLCTLPSPFFSSPSALARNS